MKIDPLKEDVLMINATGIGTVTRRMVRERAAELAVINGRAAHDASKSDWEQAKRELTGGSESDPNQTALESAPESERWDPLPGSTGHIVPVHDEGDGEQSVGERLIEEGVKEAGHDQMLQATRLPKRKSKRGG